MVWDKPLHKLAGRGLVNAIEEHVRLASSPDLLEIKGFNGMSPLMVAARRGQEQAVSLLLALGASPTATDDSGWTALHHASCQGHVGALVLLLLHHQTRDLDARNQEGATALLVAVTEGYTHAVRALLQFGADANLRDHKGRSAVDLALACKGNPSGSELVELLQMASYQSYSLARLWALTNTTASPSSSRPLWVVHNNEADAECGPSQVLHLSVHALSPDTFTELRQYLF